MDNAIQYIENLSQVNTLKNEINSKLDDYMTVETSYFESYDEFLKIRGHIAKAKTVKVINALGEIEILRPDVTLNIIKKIAPLYKPGDILKLKYDSTIFENNQYTGIRERNILGAEIFGKGIDGDLDILRVVMSLMEATDGSLIVLGHTKYIAGLLKQISLDKRKEVRELLYMKKPNELLDLLQSIALSDDIIQKFMMLLDNKTYSINDFRQGYLNRDMSLALDEISILKDVLSDASEVDFGLVSKFDYYDGMIFKVFNRNNATPIIRGGRYDKLSKLIDEKIPAVGFSLDFKDYRKVVKK